MTLDEVGLGEDAMVGEVLEQAGDEGEAVVVPVAGTMSIAPRKASFRRASRSS